MARLFTATPALGNLHAEGLTSSTGGGATITYDTGTVRTSHSMKCSVPSAAGAFAQALLTLTNVTGTTFFQRATIRMSNVASLAQLMGMEQAAGGGSVDLYLTASAEIRMDINGVQSAISAASAVAANTWYRFELRGKINTGGAADDVELRVYNGDSTTALFTLGGDAQGAVGDTGFGRFKWGPYTPGANAIDIYYADLAVNDSTGTDQATWCGPGYVWRSLPISDNARAGWTDNDGATTNLYTAVDNAPPTGVANVVEVAPSVRTQVAGPTAAGSSTTSSSITLPATSANEILIWVGCNGGATAALTKGGTYSGGAWTEIVAGSGTNQWGGAYWSRCTGNHTGQTIVFSGSTDSCSSCVAVVQGALATASPIDTNTSTTNIATTGMALTGFNTTVANTLVMFCCAADDNIAFSAETKNAVAMTEHVECLAAGGADSGTVICSLSQAASGATGNFAGTHASSLSKQLMAFALKPVPAANTAGTQIRHSASSATDNYDANAETYTTIGVPSTDSITLVQPVIVHGETTGGAISGAVRVTSNPADSGDTTFTFGDNAGAAGTYPTGWIAKRGAVVYAPSVTRGSSPVLRVGKRTADAATVFAAQLALYVESAPSVANVPTPGGTTASGTGPTAATGLTLSGPTAGGTSPTAATPTPTGGATAAGTGPASSVADTPTVGSATAAGTAPSPATLLVLTGATSDGVGPTAATTFSPGGATAGGTGPAEPAAPSSPTPGGADAGGVGPTATVDLALAGTVSDGSGGTGATTIAVGGALADGAAPIPATELVLAGAISDGRAVPSVAATVGTGGVNIGGFIEDPLQEHLPSYLLLRGLGT